MSVSAASLFHPSPLSQLRPPSSDNPRVGLAASLLAHALLVTALALGVQWRSVEPDVGVQAELWAATPQLAAPPQPVAEPTPPPPAPRVQPEPPPPAAAQRDADIAIEKAKERKAKEEAQRKQELAEQEAKAKRKQEAAEQAKRDKAEADRKKAEQLAKAEKAAEAQREKLRQQQMQRLNAQLGGTGGPGSPGGTAAHDAGPSASYAGRIKARILPNIALIEDIPGNPTAEVEVTVAPDGSIIGRRITKPSGVKAWDETVLRAIDKTAILPRDTDGRVQPRMVLAFRPRD